MEISQPSPKFSSKMKLNFNVQNNNNLAATDREMVKVGGSKNKINIPKFNFDILQKH